MMKVVENNVLVVPPFDCAWLSGESLRFAKPGRGCVVFEARAENDVTVVFKELAGCKHYRTDSDPNYTVIIGSNLNKRLKISVSGHIAVDVPGPVLSPLSFERFWISIDDGLIVIGRGDPGQNPIQKWLDPKPNLKVRFVGLSSWDKHVGYRNINVHPPAQRLLYENSGTDSQWSIGLAHYLENEDLSDFHFLLLPENRRVPAHRVFLIAASSSDKFVTSEVLLLQDVEYSVLHAILLYVYTGKTEVDRELLPQLQELAESFGLHQLLSQCKKLITEAYGIRSKSVRLAFPDVDSQSLPVNPSVLTRMLSTGELSDLEVFLEDHNICLHLHRLVLSVWSAPFAKMFTIGMKESNRTQVTIRDVHLDAFMAMIRFMYMGRFELDGKVDAGKLMLPLLILADRYGVHHLQRECLDHLLECVNEDSACAILQVASSMPSCESLRQSCEECCAKHFDYCLTVFATEFKELDAGSVMKILQHPDLLVTSEERVLNAVIMWGTIDGVRGWDHVEHGSNVIIKHREEELKSMLTLVRFPLMPLSLLQQLVSSPLCTHIPFLRELVNEAMHYLIQDSVSDDQKDLCRLSNQGRLISLPKNSLWFTRRLSSLKELLYLCDGDCNGVFYYAGTSYGAHAWMNPVFTKKITVSASSPPSRYTDPKVLVSRNYQATSFAGPCVERGQMVSWWKVDLGPEHELMCNYYTVRQDGSTNFARTWSFQGSSEGEVWTDLRTHEKDNTICRPGQYASWPVHGAKSLVPFRYFRLNMKQPIAAVACPWNFSICYLELYGYLH